MYLGIFFALTACAIWGLIFIIPGMLIEFTPYEVAFGRYFTYGIFSTLLLFRKGIPSLKIYTWRICGKALFLALICNIIYYVSLVTGLRYATTSVTVLVVGLAPIFIVVYGNWKFREVSFKQMIFPCVWIAVGMVLVNFAEVDWSFKSSTVGEYLIGLAGIIISMLCWTVYVVHNARFLKKNPHIPTTQWATILGVATLFWLIIIVPPLSFAPQLLNLKQFLVPTKEVITFYRGVLVLGVACSWLGCYLWNRASTYLPVSLIGPLMIFETVFGIAYVYAVELRAPTLIESLGVISMLGGTGLAIYSFRNSRHLA